MYILLMIMTRRLCRKGKGMTKKVKTLPEPKHYFASVQNAGAYIGLTTQCYAYLEQKSLFPKHIEISIITEMLCKT